MMQPGYGIAAGAGEQARHDSMNQTGDPRHDHRHAETARHPHMLDIAFIHASWMSEKKSVEHGVSLFRTE
jgi:hypothetical protein